MKLTKRKTNKKREPTLILGTNRDGILPRRYTLSGNQLLAHKHVQGLSGYGKSFGLASEAVQLIQQNQGVAIIDPHSDMGLEVVSQLARQGWFNRPDAFTKLIYIDFSLDRYVPWNLLKVPGKPHDIIGNFVEVCFRAWPSLSEGSAPAFENIVDAAGIVLIANDLPITAMPRLLTDGEYRDQLLEKVDDEEVVSFFKTRYEKHGKEQSQLSDSTLRRIFLFGFHPILRWSLGQRENWLPLREFMDKGTCVIFDLGKIQNPQVKKLIGCLLMVSFEAAAASRSDVRPTARRPYSLIVDEFAQFSANSEESLARILDECRKYGLFLTLAHQTWSQASTRLMGAIENAGTQIIFRLSRPDAERTVKSLFKVNPWAVKEQPKRSQQNPLFLGLQEQWELLTQQITQLSRQEAFVSSGNRPVTKLRMLKVPDPEVSQSRIDEILAEYASRYQRSLEEIKREMPKPAKPPTWKGPWQKGK